LGARQELRRTLDLPGMTVVVRVVRAHLDLRGPDQVPLLHQDVLRQVDVHGAGAPGRRDMERFADDRPEIVAVLHQEVVLGARARDADVVRLLERVVADEVRGHLPGEGDDRNRVHHRVLQPRPEIRRGGARGDQTDADLARGARVAFRGVSGGGFLAYQDVAQALEVVQDVVDGEYRAARQAEDQVDTLALQALQKNP